MNKEDIGRLWAEVQELADGLNPEINFVKAVEAAKVVQLARIATALEKLEKLTARVGE